MIPEWVIEVAKQWADPDAWLNGGPDEDTVHEMAKAIVDWAAHNELI